MDKSDVALILSTLGTASGWAAFWLNWKKLRSETDSKKTRLSIVPLGWTVKEASVPDPPVPSGQPAFTWKKIPTYMYRVKIINDSSHPIFFESVYLECPAVDGNGEPERLDILRQNHMADGVAAGAAWYGVSGFINEREENWGLLNRARRIVVFTQNNKPFFEDMPETLDEVIARQQ